MKKYLLTLTFFLFTSVIFAQNTKKVAVLETVDKDGVISYVNKLMIRTSFEKAITDVDGYEAYNRTDLDQLASEYDFQRNGMVSSDYIVDMGKMIGASYVLIAEAAKVDDNNMYVTAKIVNIETAQTDRTENSLMSMDPNEIQFTCEAMAYKLLGVAPKNAVASNNNVQNNAAQGGGQYGSDNVYNQYGNRGTYGSNIMSNKILSWEVTSRPAGADVYWRIVSSTPAVKSTNKNYKSTTPYESTESLDIKGLTYDNSGNVQIEIICEKPGYLPQKKVFNLRAAIDQESINAHFTLVKDE